MFAILFVLVALVVAAVVFFLVMNNTTEERVDFEIVLDGEASQFSSTQRAACRQVVASWCNVPVADVDVRVTDGPVRLGVSVKTDSEKSAEVSKSARKHFGTKEAATASLRAHDSLSDVAVIAVARAVVKQTSEPVAKSMAVVEEEVTAKQAAANAAASATLVGPPPPPQHPIATGFQTGWAENNGRWELTTTPTSQSVSNGYFERGDVVQGIQFQSTWQNAMIGLHHEHSSPHNDYNQLDFMTYHNNQYKSSLEQNGFDGHPKQIPGLDRSMDSVYQFRVNAQEYVEFVRDGTVVWTFGVDDGSRKAYELYDRYHVATAWAYETTHWYNFQWVDSFGDPVGEQWSTPVDGSR